MRMPKWLVGLLIIALISFGVRAEPVLTLADQAVAAQADTDRPSGILVCDRASCAEALAVFCAIRVDLDGLLIGPRDSTRENNTTLAACRKAAELGSASAQWTMATIDGMARGQVMSNMVRP